MRTGTIIGKKRIGIIKSLARVFMEIAESSVPIAAIPELLIIIIKAKRGKLTFDTSPTKNITNMGIVIS